MVLHQLQQRHSPSDCQASFPSSHVQMWELDNKQGWGPKNWWLQITVLEKTLESLLDCKEIQPVHPKENQPWIFIGRTDAKAPTLWPPDVKSWLTGKVPDAGKDWGQEEQRVAEDEMVGWHHQLNGHAPKQTPRDGEGQGSLGATVHGVMKSLTWLNNWKATTRRGWRGGAHQPTLHLAWEWGRNRCW